MSRFQYSKVHKAREQSKELLNKHLIAAIDLRLQIKAALWNVRGNGFMSIHRLLDKVASIVLGYEDLLAERINTLGGEPNASIQIVARNTFLAPYYLGVSTETKHSVAIMRSLAAYGKSVSKAMSVSTINQDFTTVDIFAQISRGLDAAIWQLGNHIDTSSNSFEYETEIGTPSSNRHNSKQNNAPASESGNSHETHN